MTQLIFAHEHVTIDLSGPKRDPDCKLDDRALAKEEYAPLLAQGVTVIVDQTARGMGRNPRYTQDLMDELGLRVLHATGYYKEPFLPAACYEMTETALAEQMIHELTVDMDGTGLRASHIGEIGTSQHAVTPMEQRIFRAAARAHRETGAPICTHTTLGQLGMQQLAIFNEYGVDLSKVVISHVALSGDFDEIRRLVDAGANVAFDTIGKLSYQTDENRALWIAELCKLGYAGQIVMSMDITRRSHYRKNGGPGFCYLMDSFVPRLTALGVSEAQRVLLLAQNPARIYNILP